MATTRTRKQDKEFVNHHFFFVEVPFDMVAPEVMSWGESSWWPAKSLTRLVRVTEGNLQVGTKFKQKIRKPLTPPWNVEITKFVPNELIEWTFKSGMFKGGFERVKVEERANGTRVDYELHYVIRGPLNQILWPILYHKQYDANTLMVMDALKDYVQKKFHDAQEKKLEAS